MELAKKEMEMVAQLIGEAHEAALAELNQLELATVGGGCGDPILA